MQHQTNPESMLKEALKIDRERLGDFAATWVLEYCEAGECGLAYDTFLYEIGIDNYLPSPQALALLKQAAAAMGVVFPGKSV